MDDGIIAEATRMAEAERDQRMSSPWTGPSKVALAIRAEDSLVTARDLEWARELAALVPSRPAAQIALAVAEGFCPAHLAPLVSEGTPFPWCPQCSASWTLSRIAPSVVFLDKPRGGTWRRLVLFPLPAGDGSPPAP